MGDLTPGSRPRRNVVAFAVAAVVLILLAAGGIGIAEAAKSAHQTASAATTPVATHAPIVSMPKRVRFTPTPTPTPSAPAAAPASTKATASGGSTGTKSVPATPYQPITPVLVAPPGPLTPADTSVSGMPSCSNGTITVDIQAIVKPTDGGTITYLIADVNGTTAPMHPAGPNVWNGVVSFASSGPGNWLVRVGVTYEDSRGDGGSPGYETSVTC